MVSAPVARKFTKSPVARDILKEMARRTSIGKSATAEPSPPRAKTNYRIKVTIRILISSMV